MNVIRATAILALSGTCAATAAAQPLGSAVTPTVDNPNRFAVAGTPAARRFFALASTRRVDAAIIGDSNTRLNGMGHEGGMGLALGARFGTYATALLPAFGSGQWGATIAATTSYVFPPFSGEGGPAQVAALQFIDDGFPLSYSLLPAGTSTATTFNSGLSIAASSPLDITGPLRYHATQWLFGPTSAGYANFTCRPAYPGSPLLNYAAAPMISSAGTRPGYQNISFDVPAGPRDENGLLFCIANWADARNAQGPFLLTYHRVENTARSTGIAYSPLWGRGGNCAYNACLALQSAASPEMEWLRQATRLQGAAPVLLVQIIHGGNDINYHVPSIGPVGGFDSSTPAGHGDNIRGIVASVRNAWLLAGFDPANLFFLLGPYHPRPDQDSPIPGYEQQWRDIAAENPQVFTVAGTMLSTTSEFASRGFLSNGDPYHLSVDGFTNWGATTVAAIARAICPADFNQNAALSATDIFAYLDAWFAQSPSADFNYSGTLEAQDIFDFLNAWFAGC